MTDQPEALRLAYMIDRYNDVIWSPDRRADYCKAAAELRRLHEVNAELIEALKLALDAHGKLLLSDPPQDAWRTYGVEAKARAAIAKAEDKP